MTGAIVAVLMAALAGWNAGVAVGFTVGWCRLAVARLVFVAGVAANAVLWSVLVVVERGHTWNVLGCVAAWLAAGFVAWVELEASR